MYAGRKNNASIAKWDLFTFFNGMQIAIIDRDSLTFR